MVKFAQGYATFDRGIDAVIEGAGGVEPNHTQTIDGEGSNVPHSGIQEHGADEQQQSPQGGQHGAGAVCGGRPGPQTIIGVAAFFACTPQQGGRGMAVIGICTGMRKNGLVIHIHHPKLV